jgi:hypothetical protein
MNLKEEIKTVLLEIDRLVAEMMNVSQMVGASFGIAYRKCGKPNCRCNSEENKGHPVLRINFTEKKKSKTRAIPKKDEKWIKEVTDNYRNFRQNFQKLRSCEKKLNDLLNEFERVIKTKTIALRDYL